MSEADRRSGVTRRWRLVLVGLGLAGAVVGGIVVWYLTSGSDPTESAENRRRLALAVQEFEALAASLTEADPVGPISTVACDITEGFGVVTQDFVLAHGVSMSEFGDQASETLADRGYRLLDLHGELASGSLPVEDWYMATVVFEGGAGDVVLQLEFEAEDCFPHFFPS